MKSKVSSEERTGELNNTDGCRVRQVGVKARVRSAGAISRWIKIMGERANLATDL
jgi:hypothetical protein